MSQCVPSWDIDDRPNKDYTLPRPLPQSSSAHRQPPISGYEVAELTWENGQLSAHGLVKPAARYPPSAAETLECIVDQAKLLHNHLPSAAAIDALVPTGRRRREDLGSDIGSCNVGDGDRRKKERLGEYKAANCTSRDHTCGTDSVTPFGDDENGGGTANTENTSFGRGGGSKSMTVVDDLDSVCHSRRCLSQRKVAKEEDDKVMEGGTIRSTLSTKRSKAAAVHNQSERKRRDRINQRMRTLQKLVPNASKSDKASMLDEVIDYLKQLQAQVQMMRGMGGIPPMMMPMGMQQFQMTMMAQMAQMAQMGMGMTSFGRAGPGGISPVIPTPAFLPMMGSSWDPSVDRIQQPTGTVMPDPFSAFLACPSQQQMTLDAYQRMATMYQQMFHQAQPTNPK